MRKTMMCLDVGLIALLMALGTAASSACSSNAISWDVIIVGGGTSGAHAAVWLRDHNRSVVLVEKESQLGGHTTFYSDSVTGKTINVGVQAWMEYKEVFDFPTRMNVSMDGSMQFTTLDYKYIDFRTGLPVANYTAPVPDDTFSALRRYLVVLERYKDMVLPGFFNFPDPDSIPEDLLMPFGDFVEKYDIAAAVPQIWDSTAQGLGDTMSVPTLFVVQASGVPMGRALLGVTLQPSRPLAAYSNYRHETTGVSLKVVGEDGKLTCIQAKRHLVAFEPTTENLAPFDLDEAEDEVFEKFDFTTVYACILRHPSLQLSTAYSNSNRSPAPGSSNYTVFPIASQVGRVDYIGDTDDLFQFTAVGTAEETSESMRSLVAQSVDNMIAAGTIPASNGTLSFSAFANHGKLHPRLTADDLLGGFIQKHLALQGHRSTWYTGAAFSAGFSTVLWEYSNVLLPNMIEGI